MTTSTAFVDRYIVFECGDDRCIGVLSQPAKPSSSTGVVIVVGGPQYRVGSHRQFTLLARDLAGAGFVAMRFDYRGMGDSEGEPRTFEAIEHDIAAACDAVIRETGVTRVVLWGLCDGASAALMDASRNRHVAAIVAVNPWARSVESEAATRLRHYYAQRLLSREFWSKLAHGALAIGRSATEVLAAIRAARATPARVGYLQRMHRGWSEFRGAVFVALSARDLTAREFEAWVAGDAGRVHLLRGPRCVSHTFADADHTFSSRAWREAIASKTIDWLRKFDAGEI